jgi:tRNA-splicing ligase RtcB (3'-phosphate/5'-hydroxy nucleic acid ligase)
VHRRSREAMELSRLTRRTEFSWMIEATGSMRVPVVIFGSETLVAGMDEKVGEQASNVAALPGIEQSVYVMPDAHSGYGFPVGGVAAFDANEGGVISAGGVGFDISCGVRTLLTGLNTQSIESKQQRLSDGLARDIPAGVGGGGSVRLGSDEIDAMLLGGAKWAVDQGYGIPEDLNRIEEQGCIPGAAPEQVSNEAKRRQRDQMGTLGSGNHYLEVQKVTEIFDEDIAGVYGLRLNEVVVTIHCGSRGLGHQIGTDYLREMNEEADRLGVSFPDRELASATIHSETGQRYLGAMRAGINCALANRQLLAHLARGVFQRLFPEAELKLLYDVSHNTCKIEQHTVGGRLADLYVHRKGATRAFGPGHSELPAEFRNVGQPVLIGGSMGTSSFILAGTKPREGYAFSSAIHGAGRAMSRHQAARKWQGRQVVNELASRGILVRCKSMREIAEEAPGAYKDVTLVVADAVQAGLAKLVARVEPMVCVKG